MKTKKGRFSKYLKPFLFIVDLSILNYFLFNFLHEKNKLIFLILISFFWIIISTFTGFYRVYRFTPEIKIISLIFKQYIVFSIIFFSLYGAFISAGLWVEIIGLINILDIIRISTLIIILVAVIKFLVYYLLLRFRVVFGGNYRKTIIVGSGKQTESLIRYFENKKDAGFKLKKIFTSEEINYKLITDYIFDQAIDEIYCCLSTVNPEMLNAITTYSESNLKEVKYIPSHGKIYSKKLSYQNYGLTPVLSLRTIHLEDPLNSFIKRSFDIVFSLTVILLLLSWLMPLVAIFIKLSSKGPVFFKQKRNGFNFKEFNCFKFRSMKINKEANTMQATKNDYRVTKLGKILRKYSVDELPQFFNVLIGNMSIVGPRPHMIKENEKYKSTIDKFMVRHYVKPGITGLAQIKGFRGEIETESDIVSRIKYDIFYIENWSFILDLKIIFMTIINLIRGEKKAY